MVGRRIELRSPGLQPGALTALELSNRRSGHTESNRTPRAVWARMLPKRFTPTSGTGGLRTRDLRVASAALSRLSYGPRRIGQGGWTRTSDLARPKRVLSTTELHPDCVGRDGRDRTSGLRLVIPALSRLSYIPARKTPETGFEPASFRLTAGRYCQSSSSGLRPTDGGRRTRTTDLAFMRGLLFPLSYAADTRETK